jgi:hypothetical protein
VECRVDVMNVYDENVDYVMNAMKIERMIALTLRSKFSTTDIRSRAPVAPVFSRQSTT